MEAESLDESQLAGSFGVREGVLIRSVLKGTPAEKAGLKAGDVMVKVDDSKVTSPRDVTAAIRSARSANKNTLPIVVMREKKEVPLSVTLEDESSERTPAPKGQRITNKNTPLRPPARNKHEIRDRYGPSVLAVSILLPTAPSPAGSARNNVRASSPAPIRDRQPQSTIHPSVALSSPVTSIRSNNSNAALFDVAPAAASWNKPRSHR